MLGSLFCLLVLSTALVAGQRGSFSGFRPIGFPDTPNRTTTKPDPLGDRFGEDSPQRLPVEANGDWNLVDRLSKLPVDKQPFWYINWQQLEEQRKNPQTYPQRPNSFVDPTSNQGSNGQGFLINNNQGTPSSGFANNPSVTSINPSVTNNNPSQTNNGFANNNPSQISINPIVTNNKPASSTPQASSLYNDLLPIDDSQEPLKNYSISSSNLRVPINNAAPSNQNNNKEISSNNVRKPTTSVYSIVDTISNNNNAFFNSQNNNNNGFVSQPIPNNQRIPINFLGLPIQNNQGISTNNRVRPNNEQPLAFSFATTQFSDINVSRDSYGNPINNVYTNPDIQLSYPNPNSNSDLSNTNKGFVNPVPGILHNNPALLNSRPELISPGLVSHAISSNPSQGTIKTELSTSSPSLTPFHIPPGNVNTSNSNSRLVNTNTGFVDPNTGLSVENKDSKFTSSSSSFASSSSLGDRFGDDPATIPSHNYNYNYNWNNSFNHQFMTFFRINSTHVPQNDARYHNNQPRYY